VSPDTVTWTQVFSGRSSGQTVQLESYAFSTTSGRYVRIVGHGNSSSHLEQHRGSRDRGTTTRTAVPVLPVASVVASANDGNLPQNTLDNSLATRWSAQGDGQWIRYDLGALAAIDHLDIAWFLGDTRSSSFDIQVSPDTVTWTQVSGRSSGQTVQLESYAFPRRPAVTSASLAMATAPAPGTASRKSRSGARRPAQAPAAGRAPGRAERCHPVARRRLRDPVRRHPQHRDHEWRGGSRERAATDWTNLAAIVRFNPTGTIDARNGGDYAPRAPSPTPRARATTSAWTSTSRPTLHGLRDPGGGTEQLWGARSPSGPSCPR